MKSTLWNKVPHDLSATLALIDGDGAGVEYQGKLVLYLPEAELREWAAGVLGVDLCTDCQEVGPHHLPNCALFVGHEELMLEETEAVAAADGITLDCADCPASFASHEELGAHSRDEHPRSAGGGRGE